MGLFGEMLGLLTASFEKLHFQIGKKSPLQRSGKQIASLVSLCSRQDANSFRRGSGELTSDEEGLMWRSQGHLASNFDWRKEVLWGQLDMLLGGPQGHCS